MRVPARGRRRHPEGTEVGRLDGAQRALDPFRDAHELHTWDDRTAVVLSDRSIREALASGRIRLDPCDLTLVQPCSVDVRCDHRFRVFHPGRYPFIDVREPMPDLTEPVEISDSRAFILHPGEFVLGATLERLTLADDVLARIDGKSSLGRLGLQVHSTAGLADPGFSGQLTLELSNVAALPIAIYPGMRIAQLVFEELTTPAEQPYGSGELGSKYQGQEGPTPSQYWRNFAGPGSL